MPSSSFSREPRDPDINKKPIAKKWLSENPIAKTHFELAKNFLVGIYLNEQGHGFIERKTGGLEYRFNSGKEDFCQIKTVKKHSTVRIFYPKKYVDKAFKKYCKKLKNATGDDSHEAVDIVISDEDSLATLKVFFGLHNVYNFDLFEKEVRDLIKKPMEPPLGNKNPEKITQNISVYIRDPAVKAWVLQEAEAGKCNYCEKQAFKDQYGNFYLEVHHLKPLADGGSDTVGNAVALCPNCHREIHHGIRANDIREKLYEKYKRLIREVE